MNMLAMCNYTELNMKRGGDGKGVKVWCFKPGYVAANSSGDHAGDSDVGRGAEDAMVSARGLVDVVEGRRDGDVGRFVEAVGVIPW